MGRNERLIRKAVRWREGKRARKKSKEWLDKDCWEAKFLEKLGKPKMVERTEAVIKYWEQKGKCR